MILDLEKTNNHIINWLKNYVKSNGVEVLVVRVDDTLNSALTALICKQTNLPVIYLSGDESFIKEYQLLSSPKKEKQRGIIVGSYDRDIYHLARLYSKHQAVDVLPLGDLFKSETIELFYYLAVKMFPYDKTHPDICEWFEKLDIGCLTSAKMFFNKNEKTTKLDISTDELEWADRENERTLIKGTCGDDLGIIENDQDTTKRSNWFSYTLPQQKIIAKLHQREKLTRHKVNPNLPVCQIRNIEGLVR